MSIKKITLGQVQELHQDITKLKTIEEWKKRVKEFAIEHNLTDIEAIKIANENISFFITRSKGSGGQSERGKGIL